MKKHKVLIVHNYYQVSGGEDTVVENEKNLLLDNGHEVIMYTRHNDEIKKKNLIGKLLLPIETIFSMKTYRDVKKIIKEERIDIVHVHNTLPLVSPSVYYAAKHCNIPVVQTVHNFRLLCPGATFTRNDKICEDCVQKSLLCAIKNKCYRNSAIQSFISTFNLWFHRLIGTYNKVDGYIALTEFNKTKLSNIIEEEKIFIKPNFTKNLGELKGNCGKYFLYLGRLNKVKGINFLIEAWGSINKKDLLIIGNGEEKPQIEMYIKNNNLNNVKLLGYKKRQEVKELIDNAIAIIVPSQWYEPFGMVVIEAFERGKPVIGSNLGAISSIISNGENGLLFDYNNKQDLINKIKLCCNEEFLNNSSLKARRSFENKYTDDINYKMLMKIYESILGRKYE